MPRNPAMTSHAPSAVLRNHVVMAVPDAEATAQFFESVLGFSRVPVSDPGWRFVKSGSCMLMLGTCPDAIPARDLGDHSYVAYLVVPEVDSWHQRLLEHQVEVLRAPTDMPWGMRECGFRTLDGHRFMIGAEMASL